jgi:ribosomal protein L32E
MKIKKPKFLRQDTHKRLRLAKKKFWRRPKGHGSIAATHVKGKVKFPKTGYKKPASISNVDRKGRFIVVVNNLADLTKCDKKTQAVFIASGVSVKNKIFLLEKAKELGIDVLNYKDPAKKLK